jgi:tripartite-type tricarboxylate transporter receptor subunit TctC
LTTSGGGTFQFNNPGSFDGITGANIAKAAGYAITTGQYKDGARVTTDYSTANFFHFTVDTDTATIGNIKGGGVGCSVGPITLSA